VYSYNIQYDGHNHHAIIDSLLGRLHQLDVVCLQEVPRKTWDYLCQHDTIGSTHAWIQQDGEVLGVAHHHKPFFPNSIVPYVTDKWARAKHSVNQRPFLCAILRTHNITIGTAHVWSTFSELGDRTSRTDIDLKMTFLEQCFAYMEKVAPASSIHIFAGDTNLVDEPWTRSYEDRCLETLGVNDLGDRTPTWDGTVNKHIRHDEKHRPDRVLVRSTTPIQGTVSVEDKDMRSDHFPIITSIGEPCWDTEVAEAVVSAARTLRSCYDQGYAFPAWSMDGIPDQESMFRATRVYYGDSVPGASQPDLDIIQRLVREREPVNIGMKRRYDANALQKAFGYHEGYYGTLAKQSLPPSLAVYTQARVAIGGQLVEGVHILHAIGLAFDSSSQPDFKLLHNNLDCVAFYRHLFRMIFTCADDRLGPNSTVVLSLVGGNNFAGYFPGGKRNFWDQVWIPALESHLQSYTSHSSRLRGMGFPPEFLTMLGKKLPSIRDRLEGNGRFPNIVLDPEYDRSQTLFINAWDPWSVVGNGNASDNSLDGYVGRSSNVGILSSSLTNPFLTKPAAYTFVR
tara:strand:- start:2316 stop:4013 length:1698 start_codon:yes stop_codon:yes gene_type:complete